MLCESVCLSACLVSTYVGTLRGQTCCLYAERQTICREIDPQNVGHGSTRTLFSLRYTSTSSSYKTSQYFDEII